MAVDFQNTAGGSATDFIDFGDLTILDGLSAFSFLCWILMDARGGGNSSIVRKDGSLTPVQHNSSDNRLNCAIFDAGLTVHQGIPDASFSLGVWHHLAITWNNSRGSVRFYLDGVLDTTSGQSSTGTIADSANVMRFGATEGGGEAFDGRLDDCMYFDRELTAAEVTSIMQRRQPKLSGMIGYWRLDEGSGSTSFEFTRNTNDGTITGAEHVPHAPLTYGYGRGVQVLELPVAATTTAEERKSVSGIWLPLIPGVTPNVAKDQEWRQQSGWSYSGILAAGGETPVVQTIQLPVEALATPLQTVALPVETLTRPIQTAQLPVEAGLGILQTIALPVEALLGLAPIVVLPVEAIGTAIQVVAFPVEALLGIVQTGQLPVEAGRGLLQTVQLPVEALLGLAPTVVLPVEAIGTALRAVGFPVEALGTATQTTTLPVEAELGVLQTIQLPVEALLGILQTGQLPVEAIGTALQAVAFPVEALARVVQSGQLPVEALLGILQTGQLPVESGLGILQATALPVEAIGTAVQAVALPVEALGRIVQPGQLPVEALLGIVQPGQLPVESLGSVVATVLVPVEALLGIVAVVILPVESEQGGVTFRTIIILDATITLKGPDDATISLPDFDKRISLKGDDEGTV